LEFGRIGGIIERTIGYGGSMKPKTAERAALILLVAYCLDLIWKLMNWGKLSKGLEWWIIAIALTVRFTVMGGLFFLFTRARRARKSGSSSL
jgi:hypothetical protein